jgi:hypothetical protein
MKIIWKEDHERERCNIKLLNLYPLHHILAPSSYLKNEVYTFKFKDLFDYKNTFHEVKDFSISTWSIKATLNKGLGSNFLGTNLDSFGAN